MVFDPFGDAATRGYLRNFAGASDPETVKRLEHRAFKENVGAALAELSRAGRLTYDDVLQTHKTLFGGFYPWAGEDRTQHAPNIAITKAGRSDLFAHPRDVRAAAEYALKDGQNKELMARRPGEVMGTLAFAHPFLDGNGRALMVVHTELAHRAGISIDWQRTSKADYLAALTRELDEPGKGHLDAYLRPFIQKVADRETQVATLEELPGLGPRRPDAQASSSSQHPQPVGEGASQSPMPDVKRDASGGSPTESENAKPEGDKPKPRGQRM